MSRIRERLTYANVTATLGLFIALSMGTAWAASELTKNEVKSKHIKAGAVKNADLADDSVTSPKVDNGSLRSEDFAAGQLPAGPQGEPGTPGQPGQPGAPGEDGSVKGFAFVAADGTLDPALSQNVAQANVTRSLTGRYCFDGLGFSVRNVTGNISLGGAGNAPGPNMYTEVSPRIASQCPAGTDALVGTLNNNVFEDRPFYVVFN